MPFLAQEASPNVQVAETRPRPVDDSSDTVIHKLGERGDVEITASPRPELSNAAPGLSTPQEGDPSIRIRRELLLTPDQEHENKLPPAPSADAPQGNHEITRKDSSFLGGWLGSVVPVGEHEGGEGAQRVETKANAVGLSHIKRKLVTGPSSNESSRSKKAKLMRVESRVFPPERLGSLRLPSNPLNPVTNRKEREARGLQTRAALGLADAQLIPWITPRLGPSCEDTHPTRNSSVDKTRLPTHTGTKTTQLPDLLTGAEMDSDGPTTTPMAVTRIHPYGRVAPSPSRREQSEGHAYTRTTTTIGCIQNPPSHVYHTQAAGTSGDSSRGRLIPETLRNGALKSQSSSEPDRSPAKAIGDEFDLLASPPRMAPNVWPSLTDPAESLGAGRDAMRGAPPVPQETVPTSARQLTPTKTRCGKLCQRASRTAKSAAGSGDRPGETRDKKKNAAKEGPCDPSSVVVSTKPTCRPRGGEPHLRPGTNRWLTRSEAEENGLDDAIAQEAAKLAIVKYEPPSARAVQVRHRKSDPAWPGLQEYYFGPTSNPRGGITGEISELSRRSQGGQKSTVDPPAGRTKARPGGGDESGGCIFEMSAGVMNLAGACWEIVGPVFDPASPISRRLSNRRSTWADCCVYALALMFMFSAAIIGAWAVRAAFLVWQILKAFAWGFAFFAGL